MMIMKMSKMILKKAKNKYKKGKEILNNPNYFKEKINNSIKRYGRRRRK